MLNKYSILTVDDDIVSANLNCDMIIFAGCSTGGTVENGYNLPTAAYMAGAKVAIGFENTIYGNEVQRWIDYLFGRLSKGDALRIALARANNNALTYEHRLHSVSSGMYEGLDTFRFE